MISACAKSGFSVSAWPGKSKRGQCQIAWITPRIRLAKSGELLDNNLGRAKPRQPSSSPAANMKKSIVWTEIRLTNEAGVDLASPTNKFTSIPTTTGVKSAVRYQRPETRQIPNSRINSTKPAFPPSNVAASIALIAGTKVPIARGNVGETELSGRDIQKSVNARMKYINKEFRWIMFFIKIHTPVLDIITSFSIIYPIPLLW